ncbi:MAG: FAD:protein FMN transferase [Planctomycetota bacterium]|nr:FAD:protein FMN transferase [Planctomycetota bacterium]
MKSGPLILCVMIAGCATRPTPVETRPPMETRSHEFVELIMASPARIVIEAEDGDRARRAARAAFDRMHRLERIISSWDPDSQSSRLVDAAPAAFEIAPQLQEALRRSLEMHRVTDGAFDLTTGSCIELWREARTNGRLPEESARTSARDRLGMDSITLEAGTARIERTGVTLNFGGIGKGLAVDEARRELEARGETRYLIDFDGEVRVGRPPADRSDWVVEIAGASEAEPLRIRATMRGLSTSGDLHQFVLIEGVRYSHVIDPRTGLGTTSGRQVTVITPEANATADALATAGCILTTAAFRKVIEVHHPQCSAIVRERVGDRTTITMIGDPPVSSADTP